MIVQLAFPGVDPVRGGDEKFEGGGGENFLDAHGEDHFVGAYGAFDFAVDEGGFVGGFGEDEDEAFGCVDAVDDRVGVVVSGADVAGGDPALEAVRFEAGADFVGLDLVGRRVADERGELFRLFGHSDLSPAHETFVPKTC